MSDRHDNEALRALFTLPPIQTSASTALTVPEMPLQQRVTGDNEIDAVLWLQKVVATGNQNLIDKALEAAKRIKTPMKDLGDRYAQHIMRETKSAFAAAMSTMGFGELESQAKSATKRQQQRHAAIARFGSEAAVFADTPAEAACKAALRGLRCTKANHYRYDDEKAAARFAAKPELSPHTLSDCLYAQGYWDALYSMRSPFGPGDAPEYASAHDSFCFGQMAHIAPQAKGEALAVYDYMQEQDSLGYVEGPAILRNLISGGWQ